MNFQESGLREIMTRATVARGSKSYRQKHILIADYEPEIILGYTCKNHMHTSAPGPGAVEVKGKYDVHIWYAFGGGAQTAVMKESIHYTDYIPVKNIGYSRMGSNEYAEVQLNKAPIAVDAYIRGDNEICVIVEMGYNAQIVGEARLWIKVFENLDEKVIENVIPGDEDLEYEFNEIESIELEDEPL